MKPNFKIVLVIIAEPGVGEKKKTNKQLNEMIRVVTVCLARWRWRRFTGGKFYKLYKRIFTKSNLSRLGYSSPSVGQIVFFL